MTSSVDQEVRMREDFSMFQCGFIFTTVFVFFVTSNLTAQNVLDSGQSLSTGRLSAPLKYTPVSGSKILKSAYSIKEGGATDFLSKKIIDLEKIVGTYEQQSAEQKKKTDFEIRKIVSGALELDTLAHRALISYWGELGKTKAGIKQRESYVVLFKKLVEENYLDKARAYINKKYQILLMKEKPQAGNFLVQGKIKKPDVDLLVEFKISHEKSGLRVVNVKLDETSLEATYRGSFNRIIRKKGGLKTGLPALLKAMEKRYDELKKGNATRL